VDLRGAVPREARAAAHCPRDERSAASLVCSSVFPVSGKLVNSFLLSVESRRRRDSYSLLFIVYIQSVDTIYSSRF
jgi:hypothetical protein